MKNNLLKTLNIIIFIIIVCISIYGVKTLLEQKQSGHMYSSYFTETQPIDVLIFGNSHVRNGLFPMEWWGDYGISSYNLAGNGSLLPVTYWNIVNALDYCTPKLIVVDVFDGNPGQKIGGIWGQLHYQFDAYPLSYHKYQMMTDLVDDKFLTDDNGVNVYNKRWELLFDLGEYHTRWSDLKPEDFDSPAKINNDSRTWKGAEPLNGVVERDPVPTEDSTNLQYDNVSFDYLCRIIELCENNNIELLLINTGYDCVAESKLFHDSVYEIAASHNLNYIDFTSLDVIDYKTDLFNSGANTHLNFSGAEKLTKYVGSFINNHYELSDYRNDLQYHQWNDDYERFISSKHKYLTNQTELVNYLLFLKNDDYYIEIKIKDPSITEEPFVSDLLNNIGLNLDNIYPFYETSVTIIDENNFVNANPNPDIANILNQDKTKLVRNIDEIDERIIITVFSRYTNTIIDQVAF